MKALAKKLHELVQGEVFDGAETLDYFATDGSVFTVRPQAVVYPRTPADVSGAVKYAADQAAEGKKISITPRGKGTDQSGGALGDGIALVFPAHLHRILKLEKRRATVQPGMNYGALQKILETNGHFLPPYPASLEFCTLGGAVANNSCGEKSLKYGCTRDYVTSLKVVLSDGKLIETRRLSARQLRRKKSQQDREGEIYRKLDSLLTKHAGVIKKSQLDVSKNSAGYALTQVKGKRGSFDLTPLIVGSQGTLGVITEITLKTLPFNQATTLVAGFFNDLPAAGEAIVKLRSLSPSAMELVDGNLLNFLRRHKPGLLKGLPEELPHIMILVEFDNVSQLGQKLSQRKALKIIARAGGHSLVAKNESQKERLWQIRRGAAAVIWQQPGKKKALPIIEDAVVPVEKLPQFLTQIYNLLESHKLDIAVWGHAGDANLHLQPLMDLSKPADRKKVFKLMDEFYELAIQLGGSTCAEHNDGLLRGPYLGKLYGSEVLALFKQVKQIFDPDGIFNPLIKTGATKANAEQFLRREYSMKHLYDHMPHT